MLHRGSSWLNISLSTRLLALCGLGSLMLSFLRSITALQVLSKSQALLSILHLSILISTSKKDKIPCIIIIIYIWKRKLRSVCLCLWHGTCRERVRWVPNTPKSKICVCDLAVTSSGKDKDPQMWRINLLKAVKEDPPVIVFPRDTKLSSIHTTATFQRAKEVRWETKRL